MSGEVCIDTNRAIDILNNAGNIVKSISSYDGVYLPITVVGELRYGAYRSTKVSENLVKIDALEMRCSVIEIDSQVADTYGFLRAKLTRAGSPIPENDIWIAACCLRMELPLISDDAHFNVVTGLKIIHLR